MKRTTKIAALVLALGVGAVAAPQVLMAQVEAEADDSMPGMGPGPMGGPFDFATVDADKDGKVTEEELKAFRAAEIAGMDADGNGLVSEAELTAHMTARMQARVAGMAKARIEARDSDGDGSLSVAEFAAPPMPTRMFDRIDADGDGAVTEAEIDAARERFAENRGGREMRHGGKRGWWHMQDEATDN